MKKALIVIVGALMMLGGLYVLMVPMDQAVAIVSGLALLVGGAVLCSIGLTLIFDVE